MGLRARGDDGVCEHCDGRGWWEAGCEGPVDCFQCHGTGVPRPRGNCSWCLGWGWTTAGTACPRCAGTSWVATAIALYWCAACGRTIEADPAAPTCPSDAAHALARVTAPAR